MKLELKHLAPYLPYGLKIGWTSPISLKTKEIDTMYAIGIERVLTHEDEKPILRPLSDLNQNTLESNLGYGTIEAIESKLENRELELIIYDYLILNHFDVFGLIPKGLAIDINTL